jgi:hypothetical protein
VVVLVVEVVESGPGWDARQEKEKIRSFGVREAGVCQTTEANVVLPEILELSVDEELTPAEELRIVAGFKESKTDVNS